jgi:hypothetical protein
MVYTGCGIWFRLSMKIIAQMLVVMLLVHSAQAASVQGDITLPYSIMDTNKTVQTNEFGDAVKASWSCRVGEFYGWETIFAQVIMTNAGSKSMWGQCSVAFYDQDKNLVGSGYAGVYCSARIEAWSTKGGDVADNSAEGQVQGHYFVSGRD